jgi:phosphohistidine phosphatase
VRPEIVWHSGKLRARQTAEAFWRACNPLAVFSAARDLQPDDPPSWILDRLRTENRDVLIAGHMPHLAGLLRLLAGSNAAFPIHGMVGFESDAEREMWKELLRLSAE